MRPFSVSDCRGWQEAEEEPAGMRAKRWILDGSGTRWLRKSHRPLRPTEPVIESLALALADALNMPAAEGHACDWDDKGAPARGSLIRFFLEPREELHHGFELIQGRQDTRYEAADKKAKNFGQTLDRARAVLSQFDDTPPRALMDPFVRMLVFDAWIGNGDRHAMNWGVVRHPDRATKLAPMYDPAGCLGVELLDAQMHARLDAEAKLLKYAQNCRTGFGDGTRILPMTELVAVLRRWPEWTPVADPLIRACAALIEQNRVEDWLGVVPNDWLSPKRKLFVSRLLKVRLDLLEGRTT